MEFSNEQLIAEAIDVNHASAGGFFTRRWADHRSDCDGNEACRDGSGDRFSALRLRGQKALQRIELADGKQKHRVEQGCNIELVPSGAQAEEAGIYGEGKSNAAGNGYGA